MTKNRQFSSNNLGLATAAITIIVQPTRQAGRVSGTGVNPIPNGGALTCTALPTSWSGLVWSRGLNLPTKE